jgi:hypothetical protein
LLKRDKEIDFEVNNLVIKGYMSHAFFLREYTSEGALMVQKERPRRPIHRLLGLQNQAQQLVTKILLPPPPTKNGEDAEHIGPRQCGTQRRHLKNDIDSDIARINITHP